MTSTSTQRDVTTTIWFPWAVLAAVVTVQVVFARWAYLAFKYACASVGPGALHNCLQRNMNPLLPAWGVTIVWFAADLAVLLLALWLLARRGGWSRRALGGAAAVAAVTLAVNMSLGYWWAMAEAIGPHPFQSPPGECPACYRAALQQQNAWTAINPGWILLACAGFDVLLWYGIRLARRRGVLAIPPRALWWKNA